MCGCKMRETAQKMHQIKALLACSRVEEASVLLPLYYSLLIIINLAVMLNS